MRKKLKEILMRKHKDDLNSIDESKQNDSVIDFEALKSVKTIRIGDGEPISLDEVSNIQLRNCDVIKLPDDTYIKAIVIASVFATAKSYHHVDDILMDLNI